MMRLLALGRERSKNVRSAQRTNRKAYKNAYGKISRRRSLVSTLEFFFRSNGRINPLFASNDKWPNTDGTFEYVADPDVSRRPKQNFFVQIKGSHSYRGQWENQIFIAKSWFPATMAMDVTLDPGILFCCT